MGISIPLFDSTPENEYIGTIYCEQVPSIGHKVCIAESHFRVVDVLWVMATKKGRVHMMPQLILKVADAV